MVLGGTIIGAYTAQNNDKVNRLVLYSPQWIRTTTSLADPGSKLGAYRCVTREGAKDLWRPNALAVVRLRPTPHNVEQLRRMAVNKSPHSS